MSTKIIMALVAVLFSVPFARGEVRSNESVIIALDSGWRLRIYEDGSGVMTYGAGLGELVNVAVGGYEYRDVIARLEEGEVDLNSTGAIRFSVLIPDKREGGRRTTNRKFVKLLFNTAISTGSVLVPDRFTETIKQRPLFEPSDGEFYIEGIKAAEQVQDTILSDSGAKVPTGIASQVNVPGIREPLMDLPAESESGGDNSLVRMIILWVGILIVALLGVFFYLRLGWRK